MGWANEIMWVGPMNISASAVQSIWPQLQVRFRLWFEVATYSEHEC